MALSILPFCIPRKINAISSATGCSAVTISSNGKVLVSGGMEGQVRVWKIEPHRQSLVGVLKEHSGNIASVDFNKFDTEVVSACSDGTCIIWDIKYSPTTYSCLYSKLIESLFQSTNEEACTVCQHSIQMCSILSYRCSDNCSRN